METIKNYKKNVKVSVKNNKTIVKDGSGRVWKFDGVTEVEVAMTIVLSNTLADWYRLELSMEDEFEIEMSIRRKE